MKGKGITVELSYFEPIINLAVWNKNLDKRMAKLTNNKLSLIQLFKI